MSMTNVTCFLMIFVLILSETNRACALFTDDNLLEQISSIKISAKMALKVFG